MESIIKTKATTKGRKKPISFEEFEQKIKLPDGKISDDEIMAEIKKVRYAAKK